MTEVRTDRTLSREGQAPSRPGAPAGEVRGPKWTKMAKRDALAAYGFLGPWILGLLAITAFPILASLYLSFTNYSAGGTPDWIGLGNYQRMLEDPRFWKSLQVTATYVLVSVPVLLGFALLLAVALNTGLRLMPLYRSAYYLPSLLGGSVALAVLWRRLFAQEGLVNDVLGWIGVVGPAWLSDPALALIPLMVLNVTTFGAPMVIFLAALRQVPQELYDAAAVDGAGAPRKFWSITLPQISPVVLFNAVITLIGAFQAFTSAYIVSGGTGGPVDSTLFYTLYLYQTGFNYFDFGYASALAWVLLVIIAAVTASTFIGSRRFVFYGGDSR